MEQISVRQAAEGLIKAIRMAPTDRIRAGFYDSDIAIRTQYFMDQADALDKALKASADEETKLLLFEAIDEADTAFAVLNINDGLTPQSRSALKRAWRKVQDARVLFKPTGVYADVIREMRAEEQTENEKLRDLVSRAYDRFTDGDMVPPNHLLEKWLTEAVAVLPKKEG